jgi:hypothetical protein
MGKGPSEVRLTWRFMTPQGKNGTVVSVRRLGRDNLVGIQPDDGTKITHHYQSHLRECTTSAPSPAFDAVSSGATA